MKRTIIVIALVLACVLGLAGCESAQSSTSPADDGSSSSASSNQVDTGSSAEAASALNSSASSAAAASVGSAEEAAIVVTVGDATFEMTSADTEAARGLVSKLQDGPVTVSLRSYGGFEKVGPLPWALPQSDEQITAEPGDVMLYQGDQMTIFTGSNSWAYTSLGHIEGATADSLLAAFGDGDGDVEVTLSLQ